jgi:hypothetical protein
MIEITIYFTLGARRHHKDSRPVDSYQGHADSDSDRRWVVEIV